MVPVCAGGSIPPSGTMVAVVHQEFFMVVAVSPKYPSLTLTPNREDRPRFVTLVQFLEVGDHPDERLLQPIRRTFQWVTAGDGHYSFICVRSTLLRWRDLAPGAAPRELQEEWLAHVRAARAKGAARG